LVLNVVKRLSECGGFLSGRDIKNGGKTEKKETDEKDKEAIL
jgi:hypothetical protein